MHKWLGCSLLFLGLAACSGDNEPACESDACDEGATNDIDNPAPRDPQFENGVYTPGQTPTSLESYIAYLETVLRIEHENCDLPNIQDADLARAINQTMRDRLEQTIQTTTAYLNNFDLFWDDLIFDYPLAKECLDEQAQCLPERESCSNLQPLGTLQNGEPCQGLAPDISNCATGLTCQFDTETALCGTCVPEKVEDEECNYSTIGLCAAGLSCELATGETFGVCAEETIIIDDSPQPTPRQLGEACDLLNDCDRDLGLVCDVTTEACAEANIARNGEACDSNAADFEYALGPRLCGDGLFCDRTISNPICVPLIIEAGETCISGACADGMSCSWNADTSESVCTLNAALGESCDVARCQADLLCISSGESRMCETLTAITSENNARLAQCVMN